MKRLDELKRLFEERSGLRGVESEVRERADGSVLIIHVANPTERLFQILEEIRREVAQPDQEPPLATLKKTRKSNLLTGAEGRFLLRTLSESLNINRHSFKADFFSRYTKSVFGAEEQIVAAANHVVYGRRGAGKSSLLLYALHTREQQAEPSVWIDMQVYARRSDLQVIAEVLYSIIEQSTDVVRGAAGATDALNQLNRLRKANSFQHDELMRVLPELRRLFACVGQTGKTVAVFLDDLHVLDERLQPVLLGDLYAVFRGNGVFLKLSAIETLTKTWDAEERQGLEVPHDLQTITLDYNLTIPDKATDHITSILEAHAIYCGLPSIRNLCTSNDVLSRLVWVAAGVPRDALNLFAQAMTKVTLEGRRHVSVSSVNVASSEAVSQKLRELENDVSAQKNELSAVLDRIKQFVLRDSRKNAFLLEITQSESYKLARKLVHLRLLHVINEGISIGEADRRHLALILDYGFYTGIRTARTVDLFNRQTTRVTYRDLRKLPVLPDRVLCGEVTASD